MEIILLGILLSICNVQATTESCLDSKELELKCGNYCFKVVRPILDHSKTLQSQLDICENEKKLESRIEEKIAQRLEDLRKTIEIRNTHVGRPFEKIGSKYYYIEQSKTLNWMGAVHRCLSLGGHLVSIKSQSEFNAIRDNLQPRRNYWIDINDLAEEGELLSVSTGLKPTYFNWHGKNPDNVGGSENCVELWYHNDRHLMNDAPCHEGKLYICEPENQ